MSTVQIPREQWTDYLANFSGKNQTKPIVVDMESNELGPNRLIDHVPLLGIEPDFSDGEATISIIAGDPEGGEPEALTHEIQKATAVWVKESEAGEPEALDIESEDGRTIVQFV